MTCTAAFLLFDDAAFRLTTECPNDDKADKDGNEED